MIFHGLLHGINEILFSLGKHSSNVLPSIVQIFNVPLELWPFGFANLGNEVFASGTAFFHAGLGIVNALLDVLKFVLLGFNGLGFDGRRFLVGKSVLDFFQISHDVLQLIPELFSQGQGFFKILGTVFGGLLDLVPQTIEFVQFLANFSNGRIILIGSFVNDIFGSLLNSFISSFFLGQIVNDGIVIVHLLLDLFGMSGNGFGIVDLIGDVLQSVEHAVQLVGELGALLHGLFQGLHTFSKTNLEVVVSLVVSFNDVLNPVGVILDDESQEGSSGLVQAIQNGFVILDALHQGSGDFLLLGNLIGVVAGVHLVHAFLLHFVQPVRELSVSFVEMFRQW